MYRSKFTLFIAIAIHTLLFSGCTNTASNGGLYANSAAYGVADDMTDIAAVTLVEPSNTNLISYSETDSFDLSLLSSMKGQTPVINVLANQSLSVRSLNRSQAGANISRIERWLWQIENTGGTVVLCQEAGGETRGLFTFILELAAAVIKDYLTYSQAKYYHAKVITDAEGVVNRVAFHRRFSNEFNCGS